MNLSIAKAQEILGVSSQSSENEIRSRYKQLASQFHSGKEVPNNNERFQEISHAFEVLMNNEDEADEDFFEDDDDSQANYWDDDPDVDYFFRSYARQKRQQGRARGSPTPDVQIVWIGGRPYVIDPRSRGQAAVDVSSEEPVKEKGDHLVSAEKANHAEMMEMEKQRRAKAAERAAKRRSKAEYRSRKAAQEKAGEMERRKAQHRESERMRDETERQQTEAKETLAHDVIVAAREGRPQDLRSLIERQDQQQQQQQASTKQDVSWIRDGKGGTLLHVCISPPLPSSAAAGGEDTSSTVREGRLVAASYLLDLDRQSDFTMFDVIKDQDDQGRAVVHAAAEACDVPFLQLLIQHKERNPKFKLDLNAVSGSNLTPLHYASVAATPALVALLLEHDAVMSRSGGSTALEMVQACLDADLDEEETCGEENRRAELQEVCALLTTAAAAKQLVAWQRKEQARERREQRAKEAKAKKEEEERMESQKKKRQEDQRKATEELLERRMLKEKEEKANMKAQKKKKTKAVEPEHVPMSRSVASSNTHSRCSTPTESRQEKEPAPSAVAASTHSEQKIEGVSGVQEQTKKDSGQAAAAPETAPEPPSPPLRPSGPPIVEDDQTTSFPLLPSSGAPIEEDNQTMQAEPSLPPSGPTIEEDHQTKQAESPLSPSDLPIEGDNQTTAPPPLPLSTPVVEEDHQTKQAEELEEVGAAVKPSDDAGGWGANYNSDWEAQYGGWKASQGERQEGEQHEEPDAVVGVEEEMSPTKHDTDNEGAATSEASALMVDQSADVVVVDIQSELSSAAETVSPIQREQQPPKPEVQQQPVLVEAKGDQGHTKLKKLRKTQAFYAMKERNRMAAEDEAAWFRIRVETGAKLEAAKKMMADATRESEQQERTREALRALAEMSFPADPSQSVDEDVMEEKEKVQEMPAVQQAPALVDQEVQNGRQRSSHKLSSLSSARNKGSRSPPPSASRGIASREESDSALLPPKVPKKKQQPSSTKKAMSQANGHTAPSSAAPAVAGQKEVPAQKASIVEKTLQDPAAADLCEAVQSSTKKREEKQGPSNGAVGVKEKQESRQHPRQQQQQQQGKQQQQQQEEEGKQQQQQEGKQQQQQRQHQDRSKSPRDLNGHAGTLSTSSNIKEKKKQHTIKYDEAAKNAREPSGVQGRQRSNSSSSSPTLRPMNGHQQARTMNEIPPLPGVLAKSSSKEPPTQQQKEKQSNQQQHHQQQQRQQQEHHHHQHHQQQYSKHDEKETRKQELLEPSLSTKVAASGDHDAGGVVDSKYKQHQSKKSSAPSLAKGQLMEGGGSNGGGMRIYTRQCKYFGRPGGCDAGIDCLFRHDTDAGSGATGHHYV